MLTADRITLGPVAARLAAAAPESVLIGHCPGRVEWRRLLAMPRVLTRLAALGFQPQIDRLRAMAAAGAPRDASERVLAKLTRLPLPLEGHGAFAALFPEAGTTATRYRTPLGGSVAWLPMAVADFFAAARAGAAGTPGGPNAGRAGGGRAGGGLTLWVVPVPEEGGADAFLPDPAADHLAAEPWSSLGAFEIAMLPPAAGIVGFPDLERLSMPAALSPPPPADAGRPEPQFLPCDRDLPPPASEAEAPGADAPARASIRDALGAIAAGMERLRPDMHALLAIPFESEAGARGLPAPEGHALDGLLRLAGRAQGGSHRIQATYPYLRGPGRPLSSPSGALAAEMAATTLREGAWRSVAGRPLLFGTRAWPELDLVDAARLREAARIGVLLTADGAAVLEDERVAAPALSPARGPGSGEVSRFLGWLRRELVAFGNRLVFDADPRDPRPGIALEGFLRRLHAAGALGGRTADDAFSMVQRADAENRLVFEIALRLAPPIDHIRVTLSAERVDLAAGGPGRG